MLPIRTLGLATSLTAAFLWAGCGGTTPVSGSSSGGSGSATAGSNTGSGTASAGTTGASSSSSSGASTGRATSSTGGSTGRSTTTGGSTGHATTGSGSASSTGGGSTGTVTGGTTGAATGGSTGASCQNDPGCSADGGAACAADGGNELGVCSYGADGCLHVTDLSPCPSGLQTCTDGTCQCPGGSCTPPETTCADGGVVTCALDVTGGCGVYGSPAACASDQTCGSGACACSANQCAADGQIVCADATHTASCTLDATDGCLDETLPNACSSPEVCDVDAGSNGANCVCPAVGPANASTATGCAVQGATACDATSNEIDTCTLAGGCLVWQGPSGATDPNDCTAQQLVCNTQGGAAACQCPAHTASQPFYVDSVAGSDTGSGVYPTGLQSPAECRYGTLGHALAVAGGTSGPQTVEATGTTPMTFTTRANGNSETFPIVVPANVTLTTSDSPANPADFVISFDSATAPGVVELGGAGAAIQGFTISNAGGAAADPALKCDSGAVSVSTVALVASGAGSSTALDTGFLVNGSCAPTVTALDATGFATQGIDLDSTGTGAFTGGTLTGNATGVTATTGTTTFTDLTVTGSGTSGLGVGGATVTLIDGAVGCSGGASCTANARGIAVSGGSLTLQGTAVDGNDASGLVQTGGSVTAEADANGVNATFDGNGVTNAVSAGIAFTGGTLAVTGADVSGNAGSGVAVTTGNIGPAGSSVVLTNVTLGNDAAGATYPGNGDDGLYVLAPASTSVAVHGALIAANGARGIELVVIPAGGGNPAQSNAATVTVDDGKGGTVLITDNGSGTNDANVRASAGVLTMTGTAASPITVSSAVNGLGLNLVGATTTLTDVAVTGNATSGIRVSETGSNAITINGGTISSNAVDGLHLDEAPTAAGGGFPVQLTGVTVASNTAVGVNVAADNGNVGLFLSGCTVTGNTGVGVSVAEPANTTVQTSFETNTVELNDPEAASGTGGGFTFSGPSSTLGTFDNNIVAGNGGDQILISGSGTWTLNGSTTSCAQANQIYCYDTAASSVGLRFSAAGSILNPPSVNADGNSWTNDPPTKGIDYNFGANTTVTVANPCTAVGTTCP